MASGYLTGFRSHFRLCLDSLYTNRRLSWPLSEMCMSQNVCFLSRIQEKPPSQSEGTHKLKWNTASGFRTPSSKKWRGGSRFLPEMSRYTPDKRTAVRQWGRKDTFNDKRKILYSNTKTHQQIFCWFLYLKASRSRIKLWKFRFTFCSSSNPLNS